MHKISVVSLFALGVVVFGSTNAFAQPAPPNKPPAAQPGQAAPAPKPKKNEAKKGNKAQKAAPKPAKKGEEKKAAGGAPEKGQPAQPKGGQPAQGQPAGGQAAPGGGEAQPEQGEQPGGEGGEGGEAAPGGPGQAPAPPQGARSTGLPGATPSPSGGLGPMPGWPAPGSDQNQLEKQGEKRPGAKGKKQESNDRIYAEDWWSHARPILELHGYFRLRAELFQNFSLGRIDPPDQQLWPAPTDNYYAGGTYRNDGAWGPELCTAKQSPLAPGNNNDPAQAKWPCEDKTQAGANIRFRLNPELHISDNLRIMSQIDLLDNLVLGSTPGGYSNSPGSSGGYAVNQRAGYAPLGAFDTTQVPPSAGINSLKDSIRVKRVWAEYMTPVGELRFGRMPNQWGLGILANSGDGYDADYQSTADRIMFITGIKSIDLYFAGAWDYVNEGPTSASLNLPGAQPYDLAQNDDVNEYVLVVVRKTNKQLQKLRLAHGQVVLNGGMYLVYRSQLLAAASTGGCANHAAALGCTSGQINGNGVTGYTRRGAKAWIPDLWLQVLYKKFRFEMEAVTIQGSLENTLSVAGTSNYSSAPGGHGWKVQQYGLATELEQKLIEDRLKLEFKFGIASGDSNVNGLSPGTNGLQPEYGSNTISTFRFHPNYRIDLILNRNILTRVQGEYYFRPSADYDFLRNQNGQKLGGGVAAIWTRASEFVQTPGHDPNLGVELDGKLYFQSKDGTLNDDPNKMGGFYTMLEYGVLFPLAGLGYPSAQAAQLRQSFNNPNSAHTSTAQIVRWYLGVLF